MTHCKHERFMSIMLTANDCMPMYGVQKGVAVLRICRAKYTRKDVN